MGNRMPGLCEIIGLLPECRPRLNAAPPSSSKLSSTTDQTGHPKIARQKMSCAMRFRALRPWSMLSPNTAFAERTARVDGTLIDLSAHTAVAVKRVESWIGGMPTRGPSGRSTASNRTSNRRRR